MEKMREKDGRKSKGWETEREKERTREINKNLVRGEKRDKKENEY